MKEKIGTAKIILKKPSMATLKSVSTTSTGNMIGTAKTLLNKKPLEILICLPKTSTRTKTSLKTHRKEALMQTLYLE